MTVEILKLDGDLLERSLREHVPLDTGQSLVRIVVRLLDERELLTLRLIETILHIVRLLQALQRENKQLGVVLVRERWKRDWRESTRLQPMHGRRVDGHSLLRRNVRTVLQIHTNLQ